MPYGWRKAMIVVFCNDDSCIHNRSGCCCSDAISIKVKLGEFRSGERLRYPNCQNYKEKLKEKNNECSEK